MKVIVAGSRDITNYDIVCKVIQDSLFDVREVVSGTARGVDTLGEQWAKDNGIPVVKFPAEWDKYGKGAGYRRNADMSEYADGLIAIRYKESKGTGHMIDIATKMGLKVFVCVPNKWCLYL